MLVPSSSHSCCSQAELFISCGLPVKAESWWEYILPSCGSPRLPPLSNFLFLKHSLPSLLFLPSSLGAGGGAQARQPCRNIRKHNKPTLLCLQLRTSELGQIAMKGGGNVVCGSKQSVDIILIILIFRQQLSSLVVAQLWRL